MMFIEKQQTIISRDYNKKIVRLIQNLLSLEDSMLFRKPIPYKCSSP